MWCCCAELVPDWSTHVGNNTVLEDDVVFLHKQEELAVAKGLGAKPIAQVSVMQATCLRVASGACHVQLAAATPPAPTLVKSVDAPSRLARGMCRPAIKQHYRAEPEGKGIAACAADLLPCLHVRAWCIQCEALPELSVLTG